MRALAFRLLAALLLPALVVGGVEISLRLFAWGSPTAFWVPVPSVPCTSRMSLDFISSGELIESMRSTSIPLMVAVHGPST